MASAEYQRNRYYRNRKVLVDEMGGKCVRCGKSENLQFDHIDRSRKSFNIGSSFNRSLDYLRKESRKCQLLCKQCHSVKTKQYKDFIGLSNMPQPKESWKHGTFYTRYGRGCDCGECQLFQEKRNAKRREGSSRYQSYELVHGTRAGYLKETRRGLPHCKLCKKANAAYKRNRK